MANEVNNETENSANAETTASEQTNTNPSDETATEAIPVSTETNINTSDEETSANDSVAPVTDEIKSADESTSAMPDEIKSADESTSAMPDEPRSGEKSTTSEEDFGSILEKFEQEQTVYHSGDLVEGKIVSVSERGVLIDFGYKSEGIAPIEDFTSPDGEVTATKGDDVEVMIKSITSGDAPPMLSRLDAVSRKSWDVVEKAFNAEEPITGRVVGVTKGGLRVDLNGIEAFLPGSQVDSRPIRNLNSFIGHDLEAKVIKFSRKRNNIVLSRKILTDEVVNKLKAETLGQIEEGFVIEGTIKNLTEYGAFVDIGGIDGLLHVTDMSWGRLQNPGDQFKVNETVQVKVLKLDREKEKVALGYKQLIPDPWSTVMEIYPINGKIKGRVSSVTDYGAFIELEPGVEGLVHVSEMSWSKRSASPRKLLNYGQEVEVQVLGIDTEDRRISLGMKQLQPNPWQTIHERYSVGQTIKGKIRNLTEFGAFVEVEDGIDGLVHVSDISHSKKIKHPKDVLRRDQEVEAVIRNIDTENRRMSLSIKDLTPSAWDAFTAAHRPGSVIRGKISRFTGFGAFVDLGNEIEGLCHISEFSDQRVERPEDLGSIGQEMDFRILRIEQDTQKIGLSARAVGKTDEPYIDAKSYSTEAKGGMASLGELMNLKRGGESEDVKQEPRLSKKERRAVQAKQRAEQHEAQLAQTAERNARPETTETTDTADDVSADIDSSETATADAPTDSETARSSENSVNQTADSDNGQTTDNTNATADESGEQSVSEPAPAAETISEEINEIPASEASAEESSEATSTEPIAEESTETPAAETVVEPETAAAPVAEEPSETTAAETAVESETIAEPVAEESAEKSSEITFDEVVAEESSETPTAEAPTADEDLLELGDTNENRVETAEMEDLLETETSSSSVNVEGSSEAVDSAAETTPPEDAPKNEAEDNHETTESAANADDPEEKTANG